MIDGITLPEHCESCYKLERQGIISPRIQETVEWTNRLNIQNINDLSKIKKPVYYEIRPSNKCNLQCRTCSPESSHLIDKEYKKIGIISKESVPGMHTTGFDIIEFDNIFKLYIAGGEPTVMSEFYQFLDKCIEQKLTNFELLVNTNGINLSNKLKDQLKHFSNFQFVFSIDGFKDLNYYIRWPSNWTKIIENWHYLKQQGHKVTVNTTVSIYNILALDQLFEFIDQEFPGTLIHCQLVETNYEMSPFLHPDKESALTSLRKIKKMSCYHNDTLFASSIDGYIKQFEEHHCIDYEKLKKFFDFNQKLDQSRQINLLDYVPELAHYQKTIYNSII
jgi:sulfatase maturation enzyme AslB (radical SAM superfamily)